MERGRPSLRQPPRLTPELSCGRVERVDKLLGVTETLNFDSVSAAVPDLDALADRMGALEEALRSASTLDECLGVVRTWDDLRRQVSTYGALVELRFCQDTTDDERKAIREAWDEEAPHWTELDVSMQRALLGHRRRPELEAALGAQAFALWESQVLAFDPSIKADLAAEAKLGAEYVELLASAELSFAGEQLDLSSIQKYREAADRSVRHDAERVYWDWFAAHAEVLDRIFDDLVRVRTGIAQTLGDEDFVAVGYRRMCRVDYDRDDVERLRSAVVEHVVPFAAELRARQAIALGVEHLRAWDEPVHGQAGNPNPLGGHDWLLARAREMFDDMEPLGPFFRRMEAGRFLDLAARKGKAGGGF